MKEEFKPIVLIENNDEKNEYNAEAEIKKNSIELLKDYVQSYNLQPKDWNTFQSDAVAVIVALIKEKYANDFPNWVKAEKLVEFLDFDMQKFQELISTINEINVTIDWNNYQFEQKDFRIKTTNERQNDMFLKVDNAIKALEKIGCHLYGMELQKATSGYIAFNLYEGGTIKPNHNLILQIR